MPYHLKALCKRKCKLFFEYRILGEKFCGRNASKFALKQLTHAINFVIGLLTSVFCALMYSLVGNSQINF